MGDMGQIYHLVGDSIPPSLGRIPYQTRRGGADVRTSVGILPRRTNFYQVSGTSHPERQLGDIVTRRHYACYRMRLYTGTVRTEPTPSQIAIPLLSLGGIIPASQ